LLPLPGIDEQGAAHPDPESASPLPGALAMGDPAMSPTTQTRIGSDVQFDFTIAFTVRVSSVKIRYIENKATANNDNQYVGLGNLTWNGCT